jgi:tetratricopeptide (TPR) repeat protein
MENTKTILYIFIVSVLVLSGSLGFAQQSIPGSGERTLGEVNFPVSCSPNVQAQFNKGLALLHNMMYLQSEKEFKAVARLDPDCAMAYWGIAMTLFHPLWAPPKEHELKSGSEAVQKAASLKPPSKREQAYISAVNAFYRDWESTDHPARIAAWEQAQEKVFKYNPNDIDAGALYALSHLATAPKGDKTFKHQEKAGQLLEKLRKKTPKHPGLFHYTIHAYDNPKFASLALEVAKEYDKIAPDAPHAQHMPSHIFVRMGMWTLVSEWNTRSAAAAKKQSRPEELSLHYIHAMDYLMYAYLQKTQDKMALATLNEINDVKNYQDSFVTAYAIAAVQARYPLERRQWAKAAKLPLRTHSTFPWDNYPWHESITYFSRGLGAARIGDVAGARNAVETLDTLYERSVKAGQDYWAVLVDAQRKTVDAWTAYSEGKKDLALRVMRESADLEDSVDKHPVTPGSVLPARELLGDMLVLMERHSEALEEYEESLRISPNRFNSLYGAGRAAELAGDLNKAKSFYSKVVQITIGIESDRQRFIKAKAFLSKN